MNDLTSYKSIGKRCIIIITEYKATGSTIRDIIKKTGVSKSTIRKVRLGEAYPDDRLIKFFVALGYSEEWIRLGTGKKTAEQKPKQTVTEVQELRAEIVSLRWENERISARLEGTIKELDDLKKELKQRI